MSKKDIFNSTLNNTLKDSLLNISTNSFPRESSKTIYLDYDYHIEINFTKYKLNEKIQNIQTNKI